MKIINESEIPEGEIKGIEGTVKAWSAVSEDKMVAGTRTIVPNSTVPTNGHRHFLRQLIFLIDGPCEVSTDLQEWHPMKRGDYVMFDSYEPHYFRTKDNHSYLFEVRYE